MGNGNEPKPALELTGRVVDAADLLDPATESRISEKLLQAERDYGQQLVVATTPSLNDMTIEEYSFDLATAWKIGDKNRNDGLLLLVAPEDKQLRIEVGRGLEKSFTDQFAGEVIRNVILPRMRKRDLSGGIEQGVDSLIAKMKSVPSRPVNDNQLDQSKEEAA